MSRHVQTLPNWIAIFEYFLMSNLYVALLQEGTKIWEFQTDGAVRSSAALSQNQRYNQVGRSGCPLSLLRSWEDMVESLERNVLDRFGMFKCVK